MSRRDDILSAARALAATHPLEEITLQDVAHAAGVSAPTVRRHVGTREALHAWLLAELPELAARSTDSRSRILKAALRTFARQGYEGATMDDIAAEAGLTKGAVYWHFASKMELFKAIITAHRAQETAILTGLFEALAANPAPEAGLRAFLEGTFEFLADSTDWVWLAFEFLTTSRDPEVRALLTKSSEAIGQLLLDFCKSQQAAGQFTSVPTPIQIAYFWSTLINGLAVVQLAKVEITPEERADLSAGFAHLLAHGLLTPAPPSRAIRRPGTPPRRSR